MDIKIKPTQISEDKTLFKFPGQTGYYKYMPEPSDEPWVKSNIKARGLKKRTDILVADMSLLVPGPDAGAIFITAIDGNTWYWDFHMEAPFFLSPIINLLPLDHPDKLTIEIEK